MNNIYAIKGSKYLYISAELVKEFKKENGEISIILNEYKIPVSEEEYSSIFEWIKDLRPDLASTPSGRGGHKEKQHD